VPRTPIAVHFSEACWLFLQDATESSPAGPLPDDIRSALRVSPEIGPRPGYPEPRFKTEMLRLQVHDFLSWLLAISEALPKGDPRRQLCHLCLDDVAAALARARAA
jgi:hypothetical protein